MHHWSTSGLVILSFFFENGVLLLGRIHTFSFRSSSFLLDHIAYQGVDRICFWERTNGKETRFFFLDFFCLFTFRYPPLDRPPAVASKRPLRPLLPQWHS